MFAGESEGKIILEGAKISGNFFVWNYNIKL